MKLPHLLPAALLLLPPALVANHETITDVPGTVAPLAVALTLTESVGGYRLTDVQKDQEAARGVTYPDLVTFDTTYQPDDPAPAILNPFGWDSATGNFYSERVTTDARVPAAPVVTASGFIRQINSRYTTATLLEDLVAAGKIPSTQGYRVVVVKFDLEHEVHFVTTTLPEGQNHTTHVNDHLYFFAETGPDDPAPVFLGAEYNDIYIYEQVLGIHRATTIRTGRYTDTFTGNPVEGGFDYALKSLAFTRTSAGEFFFYRPAPGEGAFYRIDAGGLIRWTERFDARRQTFNTGPMIANGLAGPAQGYFAVPAEDHDMAHGWIPNGGNQAVVRGSVRVGPASSYESMLRYLNQIPPVMPH